MALGQQLKMCFNKRLAGYSRHAEVSACLQPYRLARLGRTSCSDWIRKLGLIGLKFSQDDLPGCRMFPVSTSSFLVHGHCRTAGFLFHLCIDLFLDQLYSLSPEPSNTRLLGGYQTSLFNCQSLPRCHVSASISRDRLCLLLPSGSDYNACRENSDVKWVSVK